MTKYLAFLPLIIFNVTLTMVYILLVNTKFLGLLYDAGGYELPFFTFYILRISIFINSYFFYSLIFLIGFIAITCYKYKNLPLINKTIEHFYLCEYIELIFFKKEAEIVKKYSLKLDHYRYKENNYNDYLVKLENLLTQVKFIKDFSEIKQLVISEKEDNKTILQNNYNSSLLFITKTSSNISIILFILSLLLLIVLSFIVIVPFWCPCTVICS